MSSLTRVHDAETRNHRMLRTLLHSVAIAALVASSVAQDAAKKFDLSLLYVGKPGDARAAAFTGFLGKHVRKVSVAPLDGSAVQLAKDADVVVLDWPQGGPDVFDEKKKPLGERADWHKPTVLLGSSGLMLSSGWRLRGGFG